MVNCGSVGQAFLPVTFSCTKRAGLFARWRSDTRDRVARRVHKEATGRNACPNLTVGR